MATGRMARVIENLLTAAEQAAADQAWDRVLDLCEDVLAVEPDNPEASALRMVAERHVGRAIPAAGRRQVTVLFADLVGSTPMGEQLDPETYLEVIRAYETACRPVIGRYGGHINRFAGDGLIVFFGYPNAHEDDARRATRAALDALEALRSVSERTEAEHGVRIAARIGVHTGLVVLGDRGSAAWAGRDDAFGPTVNLAARLQAVATPGTVVVSDSVALLLGPAIELVSRGTRTLAGVPRPVEVFEVVRVLDDVHSPPGLARSMIVDRVVQLDDLNRRLQLTGQQPDSAGRAVLIEGEPGVGKSRLLMEVLDATNAQAGRHMTLQCSPYLTTSSLHAVREAIHRYAVIATDDTTASRIDKLVTLVERFGFEPDDVVPYLAIPLSIDLSGRFDPVELDALQLKEALLSRLLAMFERMPMSGTPFVVALEDMQWADPMTIDLFERLVRAGPPAGMLVVATSRATSANPVAGLPIDVVRLGPLTSNDARALAVATADRQLDDALLDEIARRSDGVPLYVNQLVGALAGPGPSPAPEAIPLPLMELLQSRLDAVGAAKSVAQVAATIGRDFELSMLRSVIGALTGDPIGDLPADAVTQHVARLVNSHLVDIDADDPDRLRFHHALVRDAAYASQLHRVRPARHRAVAGVLAELDASGKPVEASLIAYHYELGGDAERAIDAYLLAADRARRGGSFDEALAHVERADKLLAMVPETEAPRCELGIRLTRGLVTTSLGGWAAEGVMADYERALELSGTGTGDPAVGADSLRALVGIWTWYCTRGAFDRVGEACRAVDRQLRLTPIPGGQPLLASMQGAEAFYRGRFVDGRDRLEAAVAGFASDDIADWSRWQLPNDPLAGSYAFLAPLRFIMGDEPGGLAAVAAGLERCASLQFPHGAFSEAFVRAYEAWLHRARGDLVAAHEAVAEIVRIAQQHGFVFWMIVGQIHTSANQVAVEPTRAALDQLGAAIATYRGFGANALVPLLLLEQGAGCLALGDLKPARRCVDDALSYTDQLFVRAEGLRLRAELRAAGAYGEVDRHDIEGDLREALLQTTAQHVPYYASLAAESYRRLVGDDPFVSWALAKADASPEVR
ncbi:MAG TPA: adenylate/guanylate cyclase domain-containing protein [Acidimicrobiales bacterium]|nr:adenylate/guanylate cyclase domain-containing protein [Acidimicrobiales bacterium]